MSRKLSKDEERNLYSFATWIYYQHRAEFNRFMRYGTPSDELISMANDYHLMGHDLRWVLLPLSLNTSKGQKAFMAACLRVKEWSHAIPELAHQLLTTTVSEIAATRRTNASRINAINVAEAILYRCAVEYTDQIIFSMELLALWINKAYNVNSTDMTAKRALEWWSNQEGTPFQVLEWGTKGNYDRATKVKVTLPSYPRNSIVTLTSTTNTWLDTHSGTMEYIYQMQGFKSEAYRLIREEFSRNRASILGSQDILV